MKTEVFAKRISNVRQDQNDVAMIGNAWLTLNGVMERLIALNQVNNGTKYHQFPCFFNF